MNISRKDAAISNTGPDDEFPGSFEVVLSTPAKDRDGDELAIEDWKQPLPDHITFDMDHGMSVEKTVGSGVPSIEDGKLIVRGSYSSLPRAQEVRTLVKEGHIRTTSVAFMSEKVTKDGKSRTQRELLNGAFVAIPANREAVILSAKAGARNSTADLARLQAAHDAIVEAGAICAGPVDDTGAEEGVTGGKSYTDEQRREMAHNGEAMPDGSYPIANVDDPRNAIHAVGRGNGPHDAIRRHIIARAHAMHADSEIPDNWNADGSMKAAAGVETKAADADHTPAQIAQAVDAALDEATALLASVDPESLPAEVRQALDLVAAAALSADELLEALGVDDPDDEDDDEGTAAGPAAPSGDAAKSAAADALALRLRALTLAATTAG